MKLRQARPEDAAAICAIANPIIRDTAITFTTLEKTPEGVAAEISARGPAYVVGEVAGQVLGFATYTQFRGGPGYAHSMEHTILLAPEARGRGMGRALIGRLATVAEENGVHVLVGGVSAVNTAGIAFHAAVGFEEVGRMPEVGYKAGQWLDLVLMQKILQTAAGTRT